MKSFRTGDWAEKNQRYLTLELTRLRALLEEKNGMEPAGVSEIDGELETVKAGMSSPPALENITELFGLSSFEKNILLLCAGVELDSKIAALCSLAQGENRLLPTFSFTLGLFPGAHWSALTPASPLRWWRLIELGSGPAMTQSPLRIDERILHYLAGTSHLDERLMGYIEAHEFTSHLVPSHRILAERVASSLGLQTQGINFPVIQLVGVDAASRLELANSVASRLGLSLCTMRAGFIPSNPAESEALKRLWERESVLSRLALMLVDQGGDASRQLLAWAETVHFPLIVSTRERLAFNNRNVVTFEINKPTTEEQRNQWKESLGKDAAKLNGHLDALVSQFDLDASTIRSIASNAIKPDVGMEADLGTLLWSSCRSHAHPRLGDLAQRIHSSATWDDLVLPLSQIEMLGNIAANVQQRMKVYETWGFAAKDSRGLGISAMFTGVSGTGKTMAAEVLANELDLDLYRIDLSQVVSKYIGETEKNLQRVFDAADEGGAILLFDEADALFGKRSEVKDSHDRYANVEISYLLQRMESYHGLAILTTNMRDALDPAFLRRIRFVIHFPFPDAAGRAEIWRRIFPPETPTEGLDVRRLARLNVTGGNIRNIALNAAFLAAESDEPVRMNHLRRAAGMEYAKLEQPLSDNEVGGWS